MTRVSKSFLVPETDHMYTGALDFTTENYYHTYLYHKQSEMFCHVPHLKPPQHLHLYEQ